MFRLILLLALLLPLESGVPRLETARTGPYPVGRWNWDFGLVEVSEPGVRDGVLQVEHFGTLRFPEVGPDEGPFPLVVVAHGRNQRQPWVGRNHHQMAWLLEHLASWGFVAAAVNLDELGRYATPSAVPERGQLIQHTVDALLALDPEARFVDPGRIAFVGHDRGGEAALAAAMADDRGGAVGAVATLAPTDILGLTGADVPYLGLHGTLDGDVPLAHGLAHYERASRSRVGVFTALGGGTHAGFTASLHFDHEPGATLTRAQQQGVARTTIGHFLRDRLTPPLPGGRTPVLEDLHLLADPAALGPSLEHLPLRTSLHLPGALVVDDFEVRPEHPPGNALGGVSAHQGLAQAARSPWRALDATAPAAGTGLILRPSARGPPPLWTTELPPGTDVHALQVLSLRVAAGPAPPLDEAPGQHPALRSGASPPRVTVALLDRQRRLASVALPDLPAWPADPGGAPSPPPPATVRIPLTAFLEANPDLDLTDLQAVGLALDPASPVGLWLDDLVFSP